MASRKPPIAAVLLLASVVCTSETRGDEVALTFYGWSDQHVGTNGDLRHVTPVIDAMNSLAGTAYPSFLGGKVGSPAFVLGAGDITEWPTQAAVSAYDNLVSTKLRIPAYDILGNHDDGGLSPSDSMKEWLKKRHGSLSYTFDSGAVHFVCVFSEYDHRAGKPAQPIAVKALDFIRGDLAGIRRDTPVVVVLHLCFAAITNKDELVDSFGDANVILVLGGHYHFASVDEYRGFHFVQLPSPRSKSTMFTVFRITTDRLVAIPYDYTRKAWVEDIEGVRRVLDVRVRGPRSVSAGQEAKVK